ncbi:hypothetical protein [Pseudoscardovia radai]|uniref:hypothetical protein n=1 Tax=Pseudoscardovia radai TaxID=987066 RepID=UPI003993E820
MPAQGAPHAMGPGPTTEPWGPAPQPGYDPQAQAQYPPQDQRQPHPQQDPRQWGDTTQAPAQPGEHPDQQAEYPHGPSGAPAQEPEQAAAPADGTDTRAPADDQPSDETAVGLVAEDAEDDGGPVIDAVALPDPTPPRRADTVLDVTVEDEPDVTVEDEPDTDEPADPGNGNPDPDMTHADPGNTDTGPHGDATDATRAHATPGPTPMEEGPAAAHPATTPRGPVQEPPAVRDTDAMPAGDAPTQALPPLGAPSAPHTDANAYAPYPAAATPRAGHGAWTPPAAVDRDYTRPERPARRPAPMVAAGAVLLAALLAGAVFAGHSLATRTPAQQATQSAAAADGQSHDVALTACLTTQQSAESRHDDWTQAAAAAAQAAAADPASLQDPSLLDTLGKALTDPVQTPADCSADMDAGTLDATSGAWSAASSAWTQGAQDIQAAAQAVTDSQAAKTRQDRLDALNGKIQEARALLDSSDGQVADAQTRFTLTDAINAAQAIADDQSSSADAFDQASSGLDAAMGAVNDSIARKQADDAAAAQAAQAAAAAAAQAQAGTGGSSGSSAGPARRSSGQTAQRQSTQPSAAPQPAVTATPTPSHRGMNVG